MSVAALDAVIANAEAMKRVGLFLITRFDNAEAVSCIALSRTSWPTS